MLAGPLAQLLYRSVEAGRLLRLFAPVALVLYLDALVDGMLKGLSEQVANVRYNTITSALDVALLFVLLPRYGLGGYVFTFIAAHLVNFALSLRRLLRVTGLDFVDADQYLEEKEGMKISDIFAQKGEAYFRDRETAYIRELSQRDGIVLSLGGGAVLRPENVAAVKETGLLIHLDTPFYRILKNLSYSNNRPLLNRPDKQAETRRLYNARKAIYHRVSDTSVRSPKLSEVLDKVVKSV